MAALSWLQWIMTQAILFFYHYTASYGLAIIALTILIRLLIMPLYQKQMSSMRRMQEISPKIKEIQAKYKGDSQRINQETMQMYKEYGVNPLAGCLPTLIQLPFLWGLFDALDHFNYAAHSTFLWIPNLSHPDPLYILPVLAAVTTFWQTKIATPSTGTDKTQQMITTFAIPLFVGYIAWRFPAGLSVYWVVSNLFAVGQQYLIFPRTPVSAGKGAGD